MKKGISDSLFAEFRELIVAHLGLHFPNKRRQDFEAGIFEIARDFGFDDAGACIRWLGSSSLTKEQIAVLSNHLTVGETYFFRDNKNFEILERKILPEIIQARRQTEKYLRIWSAACCTGEEPYSVAMLLDRMLPDLQDWNITILGTDLNLRFLRKASEGVYTEWSFRDTPAWVRERYFRRGKDGRFEILPRIKEMVRFAYHNLAKDPYPSLLNNTNAMDIIFCRNVVMYFPPEVAIKVGHKLYLSLVEGGWLLVSPSETSHILFPQFATVNFPEAIFYRKDSSYIKAPEYKPDKEALAYTFHKEPEDILQQPAAGFSLQNMPEITPVKEPEQIIIQKPEEQKAAETEISPYMKALAFYEAGFFTEAAGELEAFISEDAGGPKAVALLSRVYANMGRLGDAVEWSKKAIEADKLNPANYYLHASILQEYGKLEDAVISLKQALYLNPDFMLAYFTLGNISRLTGRLAESKKYYQNTLRLLKALPPDEVLQEAEGLTAGRLSEIIQSVNKEFISIA